jgi:hypothetical protein
MFYVSYAEGPVGFYANMDKDAEGIWLWPGHFRYDNYPGLTAEKVTKGMSVTFCGEDLRWNRKGIVTKVNRVTLVIKDSETGDTRTLRIDR